MTTQRAAHARVTVARAELWRLAIVVLWIGMVLAISFLEAPLKFQAPDITIPLGLGIGRIVFAALNIAEGVLLLALTLVTFWPSAARPSRARLAWWVALAAVYLCKILVIRPPLNARTDLVLAGANPGESIWHYVYIAADVTLLALLVVVGMQAARSVLRVIAAASASNVNAGQQS